MPRHVSLIILAPPQQALLPALYATRRYVRVYAAQGYTIFALRAGGYVDA